MSCSATDELGTQLIEAGFVSNGYHLSINHCLTMPRNFALPAPWNLPSRLFQSPIETNEPRNGHPRSIGLRHPDLAAHPFVQHVEKVLGVEVDRNGAPNEYGYSTCETAQWWHAVDLITAGKWRELIETQNFTTAKNIMRAVAYGCQYSHHADHKGEGYISTAEAREVMREMGAIEPDNRTAAVRAFMAPSPCKQEKGALHWPINHGPMCAEDLAWGMIVGIEDGWFKHDRAGFLSWSELGRDRYAAGEKDTFTEKSGQEAFAF